MASILTSALVSGFVSAAAGTVGKVFTDSPAGKTNRSWMKHVSTHVYTIAILLGIAVFVFMTFINKSGTGEIVLQSIQSKPNTARIGDTITLTVALSKPAPSGGIAVHLTSSDPSVLTVDGDAVVQEGETMGTGYSKVMRAPSYLSPVTIAANYQEDSRHTTINIVSGQRGDRSSNPDQVGDGSKLGAKGVATATPPRRSTVAAAIPPPAAVQLPAKPAPLDPELIGRLEEAQANLTSEQGYWNNVKQHMPPGSSLRPEITSQLYGAESASQRCNKDKESVQATALSFCIDALNDHVNQLKIQH